MKLARPLGSQSKNMLRFRFFVSKKLHPIFVNLYFGELVIVQACSTKFGILHGKTEGLNEM
jgi:hypothetical protein